MGRDARTLKQRADAIAARRRAAFSIALERAEICPDCQGEGVYPEVGHICKTCHGATMVSWYEEDGARIDTNFTDVTIRVFEGKDGQDAADKPEK